jgi:hypothetical protein
VLDQIAELADRQLSSADLRRLLAELENLLSEGNIVSLTLVLDVGDEGKKAVLPLLTTGLSACVGTQPFTGRG